MEKESFILDGAEYRLEFKGQKESHSWTDTRSNERDGEYHVHEWKFKWKGTVELVHKVTSKYFQINFETFTVERYYAHRVPDQSLEGMVLNGIKKTKRNFDQALLADFIGVGLINLIDRRKSEKDEGLLGVTAVFKEELFTEELLVSKGILADSDSQIRITLSV
jgi:hypothetical protein